MFKYLVFSWLLVFLSCSTDPFDVREVKSGETMPDDGLEVLEPAEISSVWKKYGGIIGAGGPADLELMPQAGAYTLLLSLRPDTLTRATLSIGGGASIDLMSLELNQDSTRRYGEATLQPGVWQDLEMSYQPGSAGNPPLLVGLYLNGNLIYYLQAINQSEASGSADPVKLSLSRGFLEVGSIRYAKRAGQGSRLTEDGAVELNLPIIAYDYYEMDGPPLDTAAWAALSAVNQGFIGRFDLYAIRKRSSKFGIRFTANFDVPKAGVYTFGSSTGGMAKIYLDGQEILDVAEDSETEEKQNEVDLSVGSHRFLVDYYQPGNRTQLNIWYVPPGGSRTILNDMSGGRNIIRPPSDDVTEVELDDRPYLLRSFLNFPSGKIYDYSDKLTHVVNVGERGGPNYSYNLQSGSLLQVWRGRFVDVSEMWINRGEAQVAKPLGEIVGFDGMSAWSESVDSWSDSLTELRHLRYDLDGKGRPTFAYGNEEEVVLLTDHLAPSGSGLERTLTNVGEGVVRYALLGAAKNIEEEGPGNFSLRSPGVNLEISELASGRLNLVRGKNFDRLVAELPPGEHVTYTINW